MPYKKETDLSRSISSSGRPHSGSPANGTPGDILVPDSKNQLGHGHAGKTGLKTLVSLDGEDVLQVLRLRAVVQEAVIANLLEAVREHMEEETPDELAVSNSDGAFGFSRL